MALVAFHTGMTSGSIGTVAGKIAANNIINAFAPSHTVSISNHWSITFSPVIGFGSDGFTAGYFTSLNYSKGNFSVSLGEGAGNGYWGWNISAYSKSGHFGASYGQTSYSEKSFNGNLLGEQIVGTAGISYKSISFKLSNDRFAEKEDRWRTSAAELTIGMFSIGTYVYTNDGKKESSMVQDGPTVNSKAPLLGYNDKKAWINGKAYYSPFWLGVSNGNQLYRFGYSHPMVQNLTQNAVHKYLVPTPYYLDYQRFDTGFYSYYGNKNPVSIW